MNEAGMEFCELPPEIQLQIFIEAAQTPEDIAVIMSVCHNWRRLCDRNHISLWNRMLSNKSSSSSRLSESEIASLPTIRTATALFIWGNGKWGILGNNCETPRSEPKELKFFRNRAIKQLSCGGFFTSILLDNNELYIVGDNSYRQHGTVRHETITKPSRVNLDNEKVNRIFCGFAYLLAETFKTASSTNERNLWSWGTGQFRTLLRGKETDDALSPEKIPLPLFGSGILNLPKIKTLSCGDTFSVALVIRNENEEEFTTVWSWGNSHDGRLGIETEENSDKKLPPNEIVSLRECKIVNIACGGAHTLALNKFGICYSFGSGGLSAVTIDPIITGGCARLGHGEFCSDFKTNTQGYHYLSSPRVISGLPVISEITCGQWHSMVVTKETNEVYCFGSNSFGQLGLGNRQTMYIPTLCNSLKGIRLKALFGGRLHSAALTQNGRLYTWGKGSDFQLGHSSPTVSPTQHHHHHQGNAANEANPQQDQQQQIPPPPPPHTTTPPPSKPIPQDELSPKLVDGLLPFFVESVALGKFQTVAVVSHRDPNNPDLPLPVVSP